jgi:hypothetical protein
MSIIKQQIAPAHLLSQPLSPPHDPRPRRYSHGFGQRDNFHAVQFHQAPPHYMLHLAWDFLPPEDRANVVLTCSAMHKYARLRLRASTADLSPLLEQRPRADNTPIDLKRVDLLACAFLRFNCDYGNMIRWLEGPYTDHHRDWDHAFDEFEKVRSMTPAKKFPKPDYARALQACTQGVPLKGNYFSDYKSCQERANAPVSDSLRKEEAAVDEQLRKEEKLSYHIVLPRFLWQFFPGMFLAIFRVAYKKN